MDMDSMLAKLLGIPPTEFVDKTLKKQKPPYFIGVIIDRQKRTFKILAHDFDYFTCVEQTHDRNLEGHPFHFINLKNNIEGSASLGRWIARCFPDDQEAGKAMVSIAANQVNDLITQLKKKGTLPS